MTLEAKGNYLPELLKGLLQHTGSLPEQSVTHTFSFFVKSVAFPVFCTGWTRAQGISPKVKD